MSRHDSWHSFAGCRRPPLSIFSIRDDADSDGLGEAVADDGASF